MRFTKMQGCGNDYVYVNCFEEEVSDPAALAVQVSDRHFGIGSDGLILLKPSVVADCMMDMYNADGSRGAMCGNGIRCVAKLAYDSGVVHSDAITVETLSGIKTLNLTIEDGAVTYVRVDMGEPELTAEKIPVLKDKLYTPGSDREAGSDVEKAVRAVIDINGRSYRITAVSMGNPHAVVFIGNASDASALRENEEAAAADKIAEEETNRPAEANRSAEANRPANTKEPTDAAAELALDTLEIEKIGPMFEQHPAFPDRVNTEFVEVIDEHTLRMRVWERGSGETLACGTGACAVAVAAILTGRVSGRTVTVRLRGGDLQIEWDKETGHVFMTGPAVTVFSGEFPA